MCGYVHDLARRLVERHGHEVRVLAPAGEESSDEAFAPVRVERFRHPWPVARELTADADMGAAVSGSRLARLEAATLSAVFRWRAARAAAWAGVVCSHWLVPAGAIGASLRRPHVAVAHGGDAHLLARLPGGAGIARTIAARSGRVVCVSRSVAETFSTLVPNARIEIVPMGADVGPPPDPDSVARFRAELGADGRLAVLFLGRLVPVKGADVLLAAASRVPGVAVWIAGDGPELERLRDRARADRLDVSFLGRVDRRRRRLALEACDVVAVPSRVERGRTEGAPVVCAESYAAGRPVVATRTGGITEMIDDERTGLLVPPDDAEALAGALARLAGDETLRRRLSEEAAARAPRFSMATTADRFHMILEDVRTR